MSKIRMKIVPKPDEGTATVFEKPKGSANTEPFIKGKGDCQYICGNCKHVLATKVKFGQIVGIIMKCPRCSEYNQC